MCFVPIENWAPASAPWYARAHELAGVDEEAPAMPTDRAGFTTAH